ncbi:MAG: hypothetical protein FJ279_34290 [Planctomycetes bacterium]|nr:hypothetical protein [Planctomycetota bacterium]
MTADRDIRAAITVENASGSAKGNAMGLVKAIGGSLFGAVEALNNGSLGTLQAKHIMANVMVDGNAALVRTELDDVVTPLPPQTQAQATITTGGKATVRGKNGLVKIGEDGGDAFVV